MAAGPVARCVLATELRPSVEMLMNAQKNVMDPVNQTLITQNVVSGTISLSFFHLNNLNAN